MGFDDYVSMCSLLLPRLMSTTKRVHSDMVLEDVTELYIDSVKQRSKLEVLADPNSFLVIIAGPILNYPKFC